ncbi:MAG: hypothetical protein JRF56_05875 [Deltaproteobacteria bacterium]|jgi:hypothetical protein|nr:hypothetical protein [Deltaproteobacteria bacterium]
MMTYSIYFKYMMIFLIVACSVFIPQVTHARYITIGTKIEAELNQEKLIVIAEITNNGDEPAYSLVCSVTIGETSLRGNTKQILQIKESYINKFDLKNPFDKAGNYPVIVRTDFTDANQYPLSAISVTHVHYLETVSPKVFGKIDSLEMAQKGQVRLKLKNLEGKEKKLSVGLIVPNEISTSKPVIRIKLDPNGEQDLDFAVSNFSAIVGSNYSIFALIEYVHNDKHYSISIPGSIKIVEKQKLTSSQVYIIIGIPLVLLLLFFLFLMVREKKSSPKK